MHNPEAQHLRNRAAIKLAMVDALDDLAELDEDEARRREHRERSDREVREACRLLLEAEQLGAA